MNTKITKREIEFLDLIAAELAESFKDREKIALEDISLEAISSAHDAIKNRIFTAINNEATRGKLCSLLSNSVWSEINRKKINKAANRHNAELLSKA